MIEPTDLKNVVIMKADFPTKNGHIYPLDVLQQIVNNHEAVYGRFEGAFTQPMDPTHISHVVSNFKLEQGALVGDVTILKTPKGEQLSEAINGLKESKGDLRDVAFHPSGTGALNPDHTISDYKLLSIDCCYEPILATLTEVPPVAKKHKVTIMEYERGWGSRIDEVKEFNTPEEAEKFVKEFNSDNTATEVPDWYMVAILEK